MEQIKVQVTSDQMQAFIQLEPPPEGMAWPTYEEVIAKLNEEGVIFGLKEEIIHRIVEEKSTKLTLVAEGVYPVDGEDASLRFFFETDRVKLLPKELENGRVDHRELSLVQNVQKGQALVEKKPATPGTPGKNVRGEEVKATPGKDVNIVLGKNVTWEKNQVIATCDGEPTKSGNKVSVQLVHEIRDNVGYRTGNIDFVGTVHIRGDVESGFTVKAGGDVVITGNVEGGIIEAEGNITINGGIIGQDKSRIKCNGDLYARYIDHAQVDVEGEIRVRDAIMHSVVNSGQRIVLGTKKGMIMGGVVRAADLIDVQFLGSKMGTQTEVEVGINPGYRRELNEIEKRMPALEKELDMVEKALNLLNRQEELSPKREEQKAKLIRTSFVLKAEKRKLETRRDEIMTLINERQLERGCIKVRQTIYPGVRVIIGKAVRIFKDDFNFAMLTYQDGEISIQPYR
ncbi:MAG TPA: FapA family protein [Capillibacterium sp.]